MSELVNGDRLKNQVKDAVTKLREGITSAFGGDNAGAAGETQALQGDKLIKYLMYLKDMEISELACEVEKRDNALNTLFSYISANFFKKSDTYLSDAVFLLNVDDVIYWTQRGGIRAVKTAFMDEPVAEKLFLEILPQFVRSDEEVPQASFSNGNYIAYSRDLGLMGEAGENTLMAAVFINYSYRKFTKFEAVLVKIISELIFKL